MIVKNAAGEKYEVVPHVFFPTGRKRMVRLLGFFADNLEKRDIYYAILHKSLLRLCVNAVVDIRELYAEREAKTQKLREIRKRQGTHKKRILNDRYPQYLELENVATAIKRRLVEITAELERAKIHEKRLQENLRILQEVKPW